MINPADKPPFHQKCFATPLDELKIEEVNEKKREIISQLFLLPDFLDAIYYQDQIQIAAEFFNVGDFGSPISYQDLAILFDKCKGTIYKTVSRGRRGQRRIGRPTLLNDDQIGFIKELIFSKFEQKEPVSFDFLMDVIDFRFGTIINADTLRHFCRAMNDVKIVTGIPMDSKRIVVDTDEIMNYFDEVKEITENIPAKFIFNIDEAGCSSWADRHNTKVLVPCEYEDNQIPIPEDRNSKRSSLVGCIAADGMSMKPMIIVHRKTIDNDIKLAGYDEDSVLFACQDCGFMTTKLFLKWSEEIFFPELAQRREIEDYQGPAFLLLDGLSSHHCDRFFELCDENNVIVKFLVPHSSDQCQPLDLVTFASVKKEFTKKKDLKGLTAFKPHKLKC